MKQLDTVLIVDDDDIFRQTVSRALGRRGFDICDAASGAQALEAVKQRDCDAAVIDMRMPNMNGLELLKLLREHDAHLPVIVLTGHGSISTAIDAIQAGAFHYLTKPCEISELEIYLRKGIERRQIQRENERLRDVVERSRDHSGLVGEHSVMLNLRHLIDKVKDSDAPVLITGESGTGKELVAQALHYKSIRRKQPFIAINCATLKPELLENELFGHVSGAFTGAVSKKEGLLAVADQGTLFIDEIADMDPSVQASLLRVLETGEYRPLGSTQIKTTRVRLIAAANRDLATQVDGGVFRQDLFYRLNVLVIQTPPLREHLVDIPLLVEAFLHRSNASQKGYSFSDDAVQMLQAYPWCGNVRELFNICERAVLLNDGFTITADTIDSLLATGSKPPRPAVSITQSRPEQDAMLTLEEMERQHIQHALEHVAFNVSKAADILNIDRRTLQRKMIKFGLREL